jgi:hypothetical protein
MKIRVSQSSSTRSIVRKSDRKVQVTQSSQIGTLPTSLDQLTDVHVSEVSGDKDKYVLQYNASNGKWESVNPDEILDAAVQEAVQVGLTTTFIDAVREDLHIDMGSF